MRLRVSIGLMVVLLSVACSTPKRATFLESTYDGLAVSKVTYTRLLNGFAQAQIDGLITDAQMENILRIAKGWQGTHNLVTTLLIEYANMTDPVAKTDVATRITALSGSINSITIELITLLSTYGVGGIT